MILESTIRKNMLQTDKSGYLMFLLMNKPCGVNREKAKYNKAAIFATLKFSTKGENTSKFSEAKNKQAKKYCKF